MLGNAVVALFAYGIVVRGEVIPTMDVFFWLAAASLVIVRYMDIRYLGGTTAEGKPASMGDWRAYSLRVFALSLVLWLFVRGLAYVIG